MAGFRPLDPAAPTVRLVVDGREVAAPAGASVAAALLLAGHVALRRSVVGGGPRGPYCMMGACHECLAEVDGAAGVQTCLVTARDGMAVRLDAYGHGA